MNKETRILEIKNVIDRSDKNDLLKHEIMWENKLQTMNVYNVPLNCLIYNKYNGRILSRTTSLEKQRHFINAEKKEDARIIEQLLWDSNVNRNKRTLKSLRESGQQKVGIITKDGVIIDGNRRARLLNEIDRNGYFKAIILPVTLEENPLEIEKLETTYQMGADEKLGYNPIEKYLKAKQLYNRLISGKSLDDPDTKKETIKSISQWMSETESQVEEYLDIVEVMDEYLLHWNYDGMYTQLDEREDQFISLNKWISTFKGGESKKAFDGYSNTDVDDLKIIAFDYLRFRPKYDGKEFRYLGHGHSDRHFFGNQKIWQSFSEKHFSIIESLPDEEDISYDSPDLNSYLNSRNNIFYESSKFGKNESSFIENLNEHKQMLGNSQAANEPEKLINRALQTFDAINKNHNSFSKPEVQKRVRELSESIFNSMTEKSPLSTVEHVVELLQSIDIENLKDEELERFKSNCKEIQRICYRLNKEI
jgi:hypothetical protein